jgi:MFS family permease
LNTQDRSYRWVVLAVAVTAQMTASITSQGVYVLIPFWQSAYELSQASAALAASAMNAGQILLMVHFGLAIDRYGERSVVASTMVAMGLAALGAAAFAPSSYGVLLLFLVVLGAFYASVQPGGTRAIIRWFPPDLRGMATGVRQAAVPLGTALAAATLPVLALRFGWTVALCVQGAVGIAGGVLFWILHRDGVRQLSSAARSATPSMRELVRMLAKHSSLWPVLLAGVAMAAFQYTFSTHVILFLTNRVEIPIVAAAFFFAIAQGVGIAGRVSLAWISDFLWPGKRIRSLKWTMLACALSVVGLMLLPAQSPTALLVAIFSVLGLLGIGWYPLWLVEVAEMAPQSAVAGTISFAMTLNMIAITLMPPLFGLVVDYGSYTAAWSTLVAVLVLGAAQLRRPATATAAR